jgi:serine/threonine-protein kinase
VLALIALVIGAIVLVNVLGGDDAKAFALDDVKTLPFDDAKAKLESLGLVVIEHPEAKEGVAEGIVWETDPAAGADVTRGQPVTVFYVPKAQPFAIPDVSRKPLDQAKQQLVQLGLVIADPEGQEVNPEVPVGSVIRTDPAANQQAKAGDTIKIVVSSGPGQVAVPSVENLSESDAMKLLQGADYGFNVSVREQQSATVPDGNAISTTPTAGAPVARGSSVTLFVSSGPALVSVPPVVGRTEVQARDALEAVNLVVEVIEDIVPAGDANVGRVLRQGITPGVKVAPGTKVQIRVGKAAPPTTTTSTTTTTTMPPATTTTTTTSPATTTSAATTTSTATTITAP